MPMRPKTSNPNSSKRRTPQNTMLPRGVSAVITAADFTTPNVAITFQVPVVLKGIPQFLTNTGKLPISAVLDSGHKIVTLVYDTPGSVTTITVPENDPAIHSYTGGNVPAGTFPAS